jgi:hypothetical protein
MKNGNTNKTKNLKQKLLMLYHDDGILDLVAGITILLLTAVFASAKVVFIGLIGIPVIFYIPIKEKLTYPRIGFMRFEPESIGKRKMFYFLLVGCLVFFGLVLLTIFVGSFSDGLVEFINANEVFIFAVILGATLWGVAVFMNNSRFIYYAVLSIALVCAAHFLGIRIWIALALLGITIEAVAINFFARFISQYPGSKEQ